MAHGNKIIFKVSILSPLKKYVNGGSCPHQNYYEAWGQDNFQRFYLVPSRNTWVCRFLVFPIKVTNTGCFISSDMVSNLHKIIIFWSFQAEILDLETSDIYIFAIIFKNKNFWQKKGIKNESYFFHWFPMTIG